MPVRYRWSEVPFLFLNPLGRERLRAAAGHYAWPLVAPAASLYRRIALRHTRVVTIVGSFGKTTTARCVLAALEGREDPRIGLNSWTSQAMALLRTPASSRFAVIEVGIARPGEMKVFARFHRPDMVIVTGIGSEHNRSLGTLESIRQEKVQMVRALSREGTVVLNGDDPNVRWMSTQTRSRVVTYGFGGDVDIRAEQVRMNWPRGTRIKIMAGGDSLQVESRLVGRAPVYAILAAVAAAWSQGLPLQTLPARLETITPGRGCLEVAKLSDDVFLICDDFKASPETIESAFDLLSQVPAGRRLLIMGNVSEPPGKQGPVYRHFGERMAEVADQVIVIGGRFKRYRVGARRAGLSVEAIRSAGQSVIRASRMVREAMRPGDVILIKGRDTQRLERVALALEGRNVRCDIPVCQAVRPSCRDCPLLEVGWEGRRVIT